MIAHAAEKDLSPTGKTPGKGTAAVMPFSGSMGYIT